MLKLAFDELPEPQFRLYAYEPRGTIIPRSLVKFLGLGEAEMVAEYVGSSALPLVQVYRQTMVNHKLRYIYLFGLSGRPTDLGVIITAPVLLSQEQAYHAARFLCEMRGAARMLKVRELEAEERDLLNALGRKDSADIISALNPRYLGVGRGWQSASTVLARVRLTNFHLGVYLTRKPTTASKFIRDVNQLAKNGFLKKSKQKSSVPEIAPFTVVRDFELTLKLTKKGRRLADFIYHLDWKDMRT